MNEIQGSVITDDGVRLAYKTVGEGPRNLLPAARLGEGLRTAGTGLSEPSILENSGLLPLTSAGMATRTMSPRALQMSVLPETPLPSPNATNARKLIGIGFSMSGRFVQYLPLLSPERVEALVIIAGAPATAMELPEEVIADWVGRTEDRERLRQVPVMFAVSPDPKLLDEYADDAAKASRHALEATLRMLLTSFEDRIKGRSPLTPTLALAGRSDMLLGADVQRAIAAIIQSAR